MKKLTMIALLATLPLAANWWNDCCPDLCYDIYGGAEALYWKPCNQQLRYGIILKQADTSLISSEFLNLSPDYAWGFRIFGTVADQEGCRFVSLEWAHVRDTSSVTKKAGNQTLTTFSGNAVDAIFARQRTRYNKVSLKVGQRFWCSNCASLAFYAGGRWAEARVSQLSQAKGSQNVPGDLFNSQTFSGGGIEVGMQGHADVWCGIGFGARFGVLGLVVDRKFTSKLLRADPPNVKSASSSTGCIAGLEARIGFDYIYECGCWWLRGEIGYETNYYFNALLVPSLTDSSNASDSLAASSNFGIGGIYFGLTVGF